MLRKLISLAQQLLIEILIVFAIKLRDSSLRAMKFRDFEILWFWWSWDWGFEFYPVRYYGDELYPIYKSLSIGPLEIRKWNYRYSLL